MGSQAGHPRRRAGHRCSVASAPLSARPHHRECMVLGRWPVRTLRDGPDRDGAGFRVSGGGLTVAYRIHASLTTGQISPSGIAGRGRSCRPAAPGMVLVTWIPLPPADPVLSEDAVGMVHRRQPGPARLFSTVSVLCLRVCSARRDTNTPRAAPRAGGQPAKSADDACVSRVVGTHQGDDKP